MAFIVEELSLNCIFSWENSLNNIKKTSSSSSYIIATLFHGSSSNFEKPIVSQLDAQGRANNLIKFKDVNVGSDYIRFQVFNDNQGKVFLFTKKHVGTVNIRVSELLEGEQHSSSAVYEFKTTSWKHKKAELKVVYKVVSNGDRKPEAAAAIGNDISLFKTLPSFRPPIVSLHWN